MIMRMRNSGQFVFCCQGFRYAGITACFLACIIFLAGCSKGDLYEWRSKYVVVVETPSGDRQAFTVLEQKLLDRRNSPQFGSGNVWGFSLKGEALVLDVGQTPLGPRYLFALFPRSEYLATSVGSRVLGTKLSNYADTVSQFDQIKGQPIALKVNEFPLLVTFEDIKDPASVKRVVPADLAASFGPGYSLKSITLEITDEPLTSGRVEGVLGWLSGYYTRRLDGNRFGTLEAINRFANSLSSGTFCAGCRK